MNYGAYISGGYFIATYADRARFSAQTGWTPFASLQLLPARFLSASEYFSRRLPGYGDLPWGNMTEEELRQQSTALQVGADWETVKRIAAWVDAKWKSGELGFVTSNFLSLAVAREFIRTFFPRTDQFALIGVGLQQSRLEEFLVRGKEAPGATSDPSGKRSSAEYPVYQYVSRRVPLEPGGEILGFELLGYGYGDFTSWLVHDLPQECLQKLGVRPNAHGLIETAEEAKRCATYVTRDDLPRVEPGWWAPWLIVKYPIQHDDDA